MYLTFVDDSRQRHPTRDGIKGQLVGLGGLLVPADAAGDLERSIDDLCDSTGFPAGEEFKWSPGRVLWMHANLVGPGRQQFFLSLFDLLRVSGCKIVVVAEDDGRALATARAKTHEQDVTAMFVERLDQRLGVLHSDGIVIVDRPAGGRKEEDEFLADCVDLLDRGTEFVKPTHLPMNVLSADSSLIRLLQAADVAAGCSIACVSGERTWSPRMFQEVVSLMPSESGRVGGVSFKLHPDYCFANLYHWLANDDVMWRAGMGVSLPMASRGYASDEWVY